jgi:hypothetical protein
MQEDFMKTRPSRFRVFPALLLLAIFSILLFCSPGRESGSPVPAPGSKASLAIAGRHEQLGNHSTNYQIRNHLIHMESEAFEVALNPATLETALIKKEHPNGSISISRDVFSKKKFKVYLAAQSVFYPRDDFRITFNLYENVLEVTFVSLKPQAITWPSISMEKEGTSLIWPHFEGNYIPLHDAIWTDYLKSRQWNTTEHQYMPFWGVEKGRQLLSYLVENPFHNSIMFSEKKRSLRMDFTHTFTENTDLSKPITFRVYLDCDASPITPAKHFRQYLKDRNALTTLQDKMKTCPLISRLIGAPHAYLRGGAPITIADVKPNGWIPMATNIVNQTASEQPTAGKQIMRALSPEKGDFEAMSRQSTPPRYLQRAMAYSLSCVLRSSELYSQSVWSLATLPMRHRSIAEKILDGQDVPEYELVQLNSHILQASFPEYLHDPSTWGNGVSTRMIDALVRNGMNRFVLTCDGIETIEIRPHLASYALDKGYLIGPYDSYHSVQDPEEPEWPTAIFDRALFETGGIIRSDGTPVKGFKGVGYYVCPVAMKPYFDERVANNFQKAPHSYYFLDCDAYGEFFDDYRSGRIVSASEDAAARVDRVRSIFEKYKVPVGSEGGSYLFAGSLAVAEGVFFPPITGDQDMEINEMSRYFVGRSFPPDEPARWFLPVPLKEQYVHLYSDPRFRLPLYEAVFHDSVITTCHYASASLKFSNIAETEALTEILYQVAPMYHFNLSHFEKIKATIKPHIDVFEKTHSYSYQFALEEFEYLTEDRSVQKTRFGNLELIANFREIDFDSEGTSIPARSVLITFTDSGESFVYQNTALSENPDNTQDIPSLIRTLSSTEWEQRERAALAISRIGVPAKASIPLLIEALQDEEWQVRGAAAKALANMEEAAVPAVPALMMALKDEQWQVRRSAAYALAVLGNGAKAAVPILIEALNDEEWQVRKPAALALGSIGADARVAIPELKAKLNDPELQVRQAVEMALKNINESRSFWQRRLFRRPFLHLQ